MYTTFVRKFAIQIGGLLMRFALILVAISIASTATAHPQQYPQRDLAAIIQMPPSGTLVSDNNTGYHLLDNQNIGGTFPATGSTLSSVTIYVSRNGPNINKYRAFVLGTDDNGVPVFPMLWQSADQLSPNSDLLVPVTFTPNIPIQIGRRYFFGVDSGRVTSVDSNPGGSLSIGLNDSNSIPEGSVWGVPEPSTLLLVTTSAFLFAFRRPRARCWA